VPELLANLQIALRVQCRYDGPVPSEGVAAIILAAGASTRMGRTKALLPDPDGCPFVARLVRTFADAGIRHIVVVTGAESSSIAGALAADRAVVDPMVVVNPDPARGQLSSLWAGLDAVRPLDPAAVLVIPVDMPLVRAATIRQLLESWRRSRGTIVRPAIGERHGHPVLFDRALFDELRRAPLDEGARAVVHAHAADIVDVLVDDEGCIADIDTPEDYETLIRKG